MVIITKSNKIKTNNKNKYVGPLETVIVLNDSDMDNLELVLHSQNVDIIVCPKTEDPKKLFELEQHTKELKFI